MNRRCSRKPEGSVFRNDIPIPFQIFCRFHRLRHQFKQGVYLFLCVINPEADADHTRRADISAVLEVFQLFVGYSHQAPYIGIRAESASSCCNTAQVRQLRRQDVRIDVAEIEGHNADPVVDIFRISVDNDILKLLKPVDQFPVKDFFMLLNLVKAYFLQDFDRFSKADYAGIIGRTGFISLRSFLVILPGIADDLDRPAP